MSVAFVVCFVVGLVAIVASLVVGELGELVGDGGGDGIALLGPTTIATALLGIGAGGTAAQALEAAAVPAVFTAVAAGGVLVALTRGLLLPYLIRQQSNSHTGRISYVGALGTVTLAIADGSWGEVAFTDVDGSRVRARAVAADGRDLPAGTGVYIADIDPDFVHVVAVPDIPAPGSTLPESN